MSVQRSAGPMAAAGLLTGPVFEDETDADIQLSRARVLGTIGRPDEADRLLATPAEKAEAKWMLDRFDEAIADARQALEQNPSHYGALATLGLVLQNSGQDDETVRVLEQAHEIHPEDRYTRTRLADTYGCARGTATEVYA